MPITEADAVAAAEAFAIERNGFWRERAIRVKRDEVEGTDCWFVQTVPRPVNGDHDWCFEIDGHLTYFLRASDGRCIGLQAGSARHLFAG